VQTRNTPAQRREFRLLLRHTRLLAEVAIPAGADRWAWGDATRAELRIGPWCPGDVRAEKHITHVFVVLRDGHGAWVSHARAFGGSCGSGTNVQLRNFSFWGGSQQQNPDARDDGGFVSGFNQPADTHKLRIRYADGRTIARVVNPRAFLIWMPPGHVTSLTLYDSLGQVVTGPGVQVPASQ
jgi:hypothetical protein